MPRPRVIAEIGFNHAGDLGVAAEMIRRAAEAGADAVKFQTYRASDIALPTSEHYGAIRCGEMGLEAHQELAGIARGCGVTFLSTPFSPWAVEILESVGVPAYKVASMDCTNRHLLGVVAATRKPVYLATGMATPPEIAGSLRFLQQNGCPEVTLLHCISRYPAAAETLTLDAIPFLREAFGVPVGYSDHHPGIRACLAAATLGASVIETHFTLDCTAPGADHAHSADPAMLAELIRELERLERMRGSRQGLQDRPDREVTATFRRGLYAARDIRRGETIRDEDLLRCRPPSALAPEDGERFVGRPAARDVAAFEALEEDVLHDG